jgi:phosphoglycolate phosphatase-like HAD superfamily hydrolase
MQAGKAAGVRTIGISHGFGTPAELKSAGALRVLANLTEVPKLIEAHNGGDQPLF